MFLKFKSSLLILNRMKSKLSDTSDKITLKKLDDESCLLFGTPLKTSKKKLSKKEPIIISKIEVSHTKLISDQISSSENESTLTFPLYNKSKCKYDKSIEYTFSHLKENRKCSYPSTSSILSETASPNSKLALERWKEDKLKKLGPEEYSELQRSDGYIESRNVLLQSIHKFFLGNFDENSEIPVSLKGYWNSIKPVLGIFSRPLIINEMIAHPDLKYKGMVDSVFEYKEKPILVCWKKTDKFKPTIGSTYDAPLQAIASLGSLNFDTKFPFKINEIFLIMSYEDGSRADVFYLKRKNCLLYWDTWLQRLEAYKKNINSDVMKLNYMNENEKREEIIDNLQILKTSKILKNDEPSLTFPIYNEMKPDFQLGISYEINAVREKAFQNYPAVTRILDETKSLSVKIALLRWKKKMIAELGQEGFEQYQKNLLSTGSKLHSLIQQLLSETDVLDIPENLKGCWKSLEHVFPLLSGLRFTEKIVVHDQLQYKGIIDCIAEFKGQVMLIDWKRSDKIKTTIDKTYDAPLQIAAYIGATNYDNKYPFKIEEGLIVMSYTDGTKADIFYLNKERVQHYWNLWLERLKKYRDSVENDDTKLKY